MTDEVPLESLFVRVNILEKITDRIRVDQKSLEELYDRDKKSFGKKQETVTGIETINKHDKFIVLGKPGAGKTTYLKFLALNSIKDNSEIKQRKLPIFITLKEWADKGGSLLKFITYQFDICDLPDAEAFTTQVLKSGKCLILLDGLDEVQEERKNDIIQSIIDFSKKYDDNQYVISCRIAAYNHSFDRFTDVEMADFNDEQIEKFIENWFRHEDKIGQECWEEVKQSSGLKELATSPLLLTLLCINYDENYEFPSNRAELYESAIDTLLKKWDSTRRIKRHEAYKNLSQSRKIQNYLFIKTRMLQCLNTESYVSNEVRQQLLDNLLELPEDLKGE